MAFNIDNIVVDHVLGVDKFDLATGALIWSATEIEEPSLECGGEQVIKNDALGSPIATFDRSKTSQFTAANSLLNLSMMADDFGATKEVVSEENKITSPGFDIVTIGGTAETPATTITLSHTPVGVEGATVKYIYLLTADKGIAKKFEVGADPTTNFSISGATITLPTGSELKSTDIIAVYYEYETDSAIRIVNNGNKFSEVGKYIVRVMFADACNQALKYYGYIVFPKAKSNISKTYTFTAEGTHPIDFSGMNDYCDKDKTQFYFVIPQV